MTTTFNNHVALTKFETNSTTITTTRGVATVKQRAQLSKHTVVYDTDDGKFKAGDIVYVNGDMAKHQLALQIYSLEEGKEFILFPNNLILVHNRE